MSKDPLLQPFELKHLTLRNRIMTTSHEPAYPEDGLPKERYIAYHAERARAGVALAMTAGSAAVSKDSPPVFNNVLAYRDDVVPWISKLTDSLHEHGCAVMIQLTHLGRRTTWDKGDWLPSVSSSRHREPAHRAFPKLIEDWDIERIITDFADAAERMQAGGMDGIELQVYGHLLDQFWSPLTNDLVGPYGADSMENRLRFPMDVVDAIRGRVGDEFILGLRYTADELQKGGITVTEGIDISKRLAASGKIDFLNVVRGRIHTMPVFHAAKIPDLATARHAVSAGLLDMVGMTRAHMADPHIVRKLEAGREEDIRPCVGATYCLDRIYRGGEALCIHNAATCNKHRVKFNFNQWAEADDVVALAPDVVIIATGGLPNTELFETKTGEQAHVITSWDLIAKDVQPAERILIYDESGDHPALQAAEIAAEAGATVEIMTPDRTVSQ